VPSPHDPDEEQERRFQEFTRDLLKVRQREFLSGEPVRRDALKKILAGFCDVLAETTHVDSVTIHLKLYDPSLLRADECSSLRQRITRPAAEGNVIHQDYPDGGDSDSPSGADRRNFRDDPLLSTLAFPFSALPRGGLQLVAWNKNSPWFELLRHAHTKSDPPDAARTDGDGDSPTDKEREARAKESYSIVRLSSNITAQIVQDQRARRRGRTKILATRNDRKLGTADALVWTNQGLNRMFRNYFGVPVRLHSDGEVIGLLKLENKNQIGNEKESVTRDPAVTLRDLVDQVIDLIVEPAGNVAWCKKNDQLLANGSMTDVLLSLVDHAVPPASDTWDSYLKELAKHGISMLAMAYLKADLLQANEPSSTGAPDLGQDAAKYFPEFPNQGRLLGTSSDHATSGIATLRPPPQDAPPPFQLWAKTPDAERWLCSYITKDKEKEGVAISPQVLLGVLRELREKLEKQLRAVEANGTSEPRSEENVEVNGLCFLVCRDRSDSGASLPPFTYRLVLQNNGGMEFFAMIPPGRSEQDLLDSRLPDSDREIFWAINPEWAPMKSEKNSNSARSFTAFKYAGERVVAVSGDKGEQKLAVELPDLLADRLAARVQALIYALPFPEFDPVDSEMLSWAAHEVANLVRLEIVYRGNRHERPMPLTDAEFDRLPISDLSFVDDLRDRVERAGAVKPNIDHHIHNMLNDWKMTPTVACESRVKNSRSYLERLGERYEGRVRGSLAVWFFLLGALPRNDDDEGTVSTQLRQFTERVREFVPLVGGSQATSLTKRELTHVIETMQKWNAEDEPMEAPFADFGFCSWPWQDSFDTEITDRELWQLVADNLQLVGQHDESDFKELYDSDGLRPQALANCVLRNHEQYVRIASSLLVQLYESRSGAQHCEDYRSVYRTMFALRRLLSSSASKIKNSPKFAGLRKLFNEHADEWKWTDFVHYAASNSTDQFLSEVGTDQADRERVRLTAAGIYRRIRTLLYRLREQTSTAHLDWQLDRFDLFGAQLNCLFKNQVAALYEEFWDRGDPFQGRDRTPIWTPSQRTRWVCVRTNVHTGDYNSLQIASLVDPSALRRRFWASGDDPLGAIYNLSLLRLYWSRALRRLSSEDGGFCSQYRTLAELRKEWTAEYVDWFQKAEQNWDSENRESPGDFDIFFGAAVVDLVLWALGKYGERIARAEDAVTRELRSTLRGLGSSLRKLMDKIEELLRKDSSSECLLNLHSDSHLKPVVSELRGCVKVFYPEEPDSEPDGCSPAFETVFKKWYAGLESRLPEEDEFVTTTISDLIKHERRLFTESSRNNELLLERTARGITLFVHYLTRDEFHSVVTGLESDQHELQFRAWERYRRSQKDYLFWLGEGRGKDLSGLRGREQVLSRVENLTLLWSEELAAPEQEEDPAFLNRVRKWNARDLFYYVRSLIPMEIQARTHLANVLAEQYHDRVYKRHPDVASLVPRTRMNEVASHLDDLDKELEIDFEDYVEREWLHEQDDR